MIRYVVEIRHANPGERYLTIDGEVTTATRKSLYEWPVIIDQYEVTGYAYPGDPAWEARITT